MKLEEFDYVLPSELIAQHPCHERDSSRLMVLGRATGSISHHIFRELPTLLKRGDLLIVNDSRVLQARLVGTKSGTAGRAELLLLHPSTGARTAEALSKPVEATDWICLGQSSKGFKRGTRLRFEEMEAEVIEILGDGQYAVRFQSALGESMSTALARIGQMPLPPYIHRPTDLQDFERYQTVYSSEPGSVAAPTAGLHFTPTLLNSLTEQGVEIATLRLEVGPGTFLPVRETEIEKHHMHRERYFVPAETAQAIARARKEGRRIVAVGTTVVRTLESAWSDASNTLNPGWSETALFIFPGYHFRVADALITNFHLPRSSLLMLVSAFAGMDFIKMAYREAISSRYRFFSYGDAMYIE